MASPQEVRSWLDSALGAGVEFADAAEAIVQDHGEEVAPILYQAWQEKYASDEADRPAVGHTYKDAEGGTYKILSVDSDPAQNDYKVSFTDSVGQQGTVSGGFWRKMVWQRGITQARLTQHAFAMSDVVQNRQSGEKGRVVNLSPLTIKTQRGEEVQPAGLPENEWKLSTTQTQPYKEIQPGTDPEDVREQLNLVQELLSGSKKQAAPTLPPQAKLAHIKSGYEELNIDRSGTPADVDPSKPRQELLRGFYCASCIWYKRNGDQPTGGSCIHPELKGADGHINDFGCCVFWENPDLTTYSFKDLVQTLASRKLAKGKGQSDNPYQQYERNVPLQIEYETDVGPTVYPRDFIHEQNRPSERSDSVKRRDQNEEPLWSGSKEGVKEATLDTVVAALELDLQAAVALSAEKQGPGPTFSQTEKPEQPSAQDSTSELPALEKEEGVPAFTKGGALRKIAFIAGDRVRCLDTQDEGTIAYANDHFVIRWDDGSQTQHGPDEMAHMEVTDGVEQVASKVPPSLATAGEPSEDLGVFDQIAPQAPSPNLF